MDSILQKRLDFRLKVVGRERHIVPGLFGMLDVCEIFFFVLTSNGL